VPSSLASDDAIEVVKRGRQPHDLIVAQSISATVPTPNATAFKGDGKGLSLRALMDRHSRRVLAVVRRFLWDPRDAEEVLQETFLELWQRTLRSDPHGDSAAWLMTIARSRSIDRLRANATAKRGLADAAAQPEPIAPSPDELEDRRRDNERVHAALDALKPKQHDVVQLSFFGGLSLAEIAGKVGAPLGTVKLRMRTAMAKLARLLRNSRPATA
jgi:RNA polymerase sigma-70 factor (ECF subfamily)